MKRTLWALLDDRAGSVGQAKGILQALDGSMDIVEKQIVYNGWARLPNFLRGCSLIGIDRTQSDSFDGAAPDIILSISRRTLPVARYIRKKSGQKSKIVQLMYPGKSGLKDIELVVVSEHDRQKCSGSGFFYITGCPHRMTEEKLEEARQKWQAEFAALPRPLTTLIIGGAIKGKAFSVENAADLGKQVRRLKEEKGGSLMITSSRRTGKEAETAVLKELEGIPAYTYLWGETKENPFMGFLACADEIIVTGDSVSMCSEACGTGKPVLIFEGTGWLTPKHRRFVRSLYDGHYALPLEKYADSPDFVPAQRLLPAQTVAKQILKIR